MSTTRRHYLRGTAAVLGGGLAGCLGDPLGETRPSGTGGPGINLVSTDGDIELPVRPSVEVIREGATLDHPPRLRTTLTNTRDERVRIGEGRAVHFEYITDVSGALVLLPGESEQEYPAESDCWRLMDDIPLTKEYQTFEVAPGELHSRPVDLYATPEVDGCLPIGEHRFETTISIVSAVAEPQASAKWGLSILLE